MRRDITKSIAAAAVVLLAGLAGALVSWDATSRARQARDTETAPPRPARQVDTPNPPRKGESRHPGKSPVDLKELLLGVPNERLVRFKSDQAYRDFLARLKDRDLRLLGKLDNLRTARIGYDDLSELEELLGPDDESIGNYYVSIPDQLPQVDAQPGAIGFGRGTLEWLGITSDNATWGDGVRIAMLDTGVGSHAAFPDSIREIDLITGEGPPIDLHGHGTAVAALLVGSDSINQGIARPRS